MMIYWYVEQKSNGAEKNSRMLAGRAKSIAAYQLSCCCNATEDTANKQNAAGEIKMTRGGRAEEDRIVVMVKIHENGRLAGKPPLCTRGGPTVVDQRWLL